MKNLIFVFIFIFFAMGFAISAYAEPLEVTFTPDPLFENTNFLPGDDAIGEVSVTNNTGSTQNILTEAINIIDGDNLSNLLQIVIQDSNGILFNNSLKNFLSTAGEISLGTISNGETRDFDFTVSFVGSDNAFQAKTLGFDICIGFEGGNTHCGDTAVGGGGGTITGGGGGGGGINFVPLTISGEQEQNLQEELNQITITWNTNKLATSQVIYGPDTSTYVLDLNAVNFGYPFSTVEDTIKVLSHSVLLTGLIPGQTYVYRVVSRASPPTISPERKFAFIPSTKLLIPQTFDSENFTNNSDSQNVSDGASGQVLGESIFTPSSVGEIGEGIEYNPEDPENSFTNALASVNATEMGELFSNRNIIVAFILLLLILFFLWLWRKKKKDSEANS